jgi:hypothetical protein
MAKSWSWALDGNMEIDHPITNVLAFDMPQKVFVSGGKSMADNHANRNEATSSSNNNQTKKQIIRHKGVITDEFFGKIKANWGVHSQHAVTHMTSNSTQNPSSKAVTVPATLPMSSAVMVSNNTTSSAAASQITATSTSSTTVARRKRKNGE